MVIWSFGLFFWSSNSISTCPFSYINCIQIRSKDQTVLLSFTI